jgi:hypothetical protein
MPSPIPGPLPFATQTVSGQVSIAAQDFAGDKTFFGKIFNSNPLGLAQYTTAGLPAAASHAGSVVYDTDTDTVKFSDGATWTGVSSGGTVTGTGVSGRVAFWGGASSLSSDVNLFWDDASNRLGIGTVIPGAALDVVGSALISANLTVSGNTILGDASGDTLTLNGTAVGIPNNLNFDSNTFFIDAANDRAGFLATAPTYNSKVWLNHDFGTALLDSPAINVGLECIITGQAQSAFDEVLASAYFETVATGSPSLGILHGLYSRTTNSGTAALSSQRSMTVQSVQNSAISNLSGATNHVIGIYSESEIRAAGSMPNFRAFSVRAPIRTGTGTWTNHYGLYLEDTDITGVTNAWGVYQLGGTVRNYFAGNTGFGSGASSPATTAVIDVSSSLVGGGLVRIQSTAATGFGEISFRNSGGTTVLNFGQGNASTPSPFTSKNYLQINGQDLIFTSGSTVIGSFTAAGNFFVDTNVLFVDAGTNRVGINTSSPTEALHVVGNVLATGLGTINGGLDISGTTTSAIKYAFTNASGTPGNATINRPTGRVAIASGASAVTVTNSVVTASSVITSTIETADATLGYLQVVPAAGSFTITNRVGLTATAVTGDVTVSFVVHTN